MNNLFYKIFPPRAPIPYRPFSRLYGRDFIFLYAGDIRTNDKHYRQFPMMGLSLTRNDKRHIKHDITHCHDLPDNSVDIYQAEEVFEHIDYNALEYVIKEIYRILKPGGLFRLSVPDYRFNIYLQECLLKDKNGNILFDPQGGGNFDLKTGKVINGGHVWFPVYETVKSLLDKAPFSQVNFLHYYDKKGVMHCDEIDYSKGYISRTHDNNKKTMSIVVDSYK